MAVNSSLQARACKMGQIVHLNHPARCLSAANNNIQDGGGLVRGMKAAAFAGSYSATRNCHQIEHRVSEWKVFCVFDVFDVPGERGGDAPRRGERKVTCRSRRAAASDERGVTMKIAFVQPWIITNNPLRGGPHCNYLLCDALLRGALLPSITSLCLPWQMETSHWLTKLGRWIYKAAFLTQKRAVF